MNIVEKLTSYDRGVEPRLSIFREGVFAKLYNESAYLFVRNIHEYKVNVTDSRRGRYFSLGFPVSLLERLISGHPGSVLKEIEDGYWICTLPSASFDSDDYECWCMEASRSAEEDSVRKPSCVAPLRREAALSSFAAVPLNRGAALSTSKTDVPTVSDEEKALEVVLSEIRQFRIDRATPLECMLFLQSVQSRIPAAPAE